jgi:hypothetical protein
VSLLQNMQAERATGTLQVRSGAQTAQLYFLFGHLFHAQMGAGQDASVQGEAAVFTALAWREGEYAFDPKAKLPPEETIKASTQEIVQEAAARGLASAGEQSPAYAAAPAPDAALEPAEQTAANVPSELYPLPLGALVYESLKTAFVDFPKLLRSLQIDHLTGYLRLAANNASGMVLLYRGNLMEALYDGGAVVSTGRSAFQLIKGSVDRGEGTLDVHSLSDEVVRGIYHLLTAPPYLQGLVARFVKPDELLAHLQEVRLTGPVIMRSPEDLGVILLQEGKVLGAYTRQGRELSDRADAVFALCQNPATRIEVRAAQPGSEPPSMSLEEALSGSQGPSREAMAPFPAPPPAAAAPASPPARPPAVDWDNVFAELSAMADRVLGNRSKKVREALSATPASREDLLRTIGRLPQLSILLIDQRKLVTLSEDMRAFVEALP